MLVGDTQSMYREAIEHAIADWPEIELVGLVGGDAFLRELKRARPDVAIVDPTCLTLEDHEQLLDLAAACMRIAALAVDADPPEAEHQEEEARALAAAGTRIMFLSADPEARAVYHAIASGIAGYLSKDCDSRELAHAITTAAHGKDVLSPSFQPDLLKEIRLRGREDRPVLTDREHDIMRLVAEGRTTPQIASDLGLRPTTVKTHLTHIYEKLGAHERAEAVHKAMQWRVID